MRENESLRNSCGIPTDCPAKIKMGLAALPAAGGEICRGGKGGFESSRTRRRNETEEWKTSLSSGSLPPRRRWEFRPCGGLLGKAAAVALRAAAANWTVPPRRSIQLSPKTRVARISAPARERLPPARTRLLHVRNRAPRGRVGRNRPSQTGRGRITCTIRQGKGRRNAPTGPPP